MSGTTDNPHNFNLEDLALTRVDVIEKRANLAYVLINKSHLEMEVLSALMLCESKNVCCKNACSIFTTPQIRKPNKLLQTNTGNQNYNECTYSPQHVGICWLQKKQKHYP